MRVRENTSAIGAVAKLRIFATGGGGLWGPASCRSLVLRRLHADEADAEQNAGAMKRLTQIETSIIELGNEDLLDLADIFRERSEATIAQYAFAEMARRKITF